MNTLVMMLASVSSICLLNVFILAQYYEGQKSTRGYTLKESIPSIHLPILTPGDTLVINEFQPYEYHQRWMLQGDHVAHRDDPNTVLDIAECNCDEGARVCSWEHNGGSNQQWIFEYQLVCPSLSSGSLSSICHLLHPRLEILILIARKLDGWGIPNPLIGWVE